MLSDHQSELNKLMTDIQDAKTLNMCSRNQQLVLQKLRHSKRLSEEIKHKIDELAEAKNTCILEEAQTRRIGITAYKNQVTNPQEIITQFWPVPTEVKAS